MKVKLDENFGPSVAALFRSGGWDCQTVREEGLSGARDEEVLRVAVAEARILVTLDHDFANVLRYPPDATSGIADVCPSGQVSTKLLSWLVERFIEAATARSIRGKLWIVEPTRIREHGE